MRFFLVVTMLLILAPAVCSAAQVQLVAGTTVGVWIPDALTRNTSTMSGGAVGDGQTPLPWEGPMPAVSVPQAQLPTATIGSASRPTPLPEPAIMSMLASLGVGLALWGLFRWQRQRMAA